MSRPIKVCVVMGTRPEVIKCWPVIRRLTDLPAFEVQTVLTGQHRELARQAIRMLNVPVTTDLDVMTPNQTLADLTARLCRSLRDAIEALGPDCVLVQGDTTTVFVASLIAFYAGIPVGHIEAGLRTDDVRHPFPEEMNRRLTGALATLHFAPTPRAREALRRENVPDERIHVTGNTGIDALRLIRDSIEGDPSDPKLSAALADGASRIVAVTVHRRENRAYMRGIAQAFVRLCRAHDDLRIVFPVHLGPAVREAFLPVLRDCPGCVLTEPLGYPDFIRLLDGCRFVMTDSGGVQEEAPYLGKPVLVMRRTTERPEAVEAGVAKLIGEQPDDIVRAATQLLTDTDAYRSMAVAVSPYGDGHAAERIADILEQTIQRGD